MSTTTTSRSMITVSPPRKTHRIEPNREVPPSVAAARLHSSDVPCPLRGAICAHLLGREVSDYAKRTVWQLLYATPLRGDALTFAETIVNATREELTRIPHYENLISSWAHDAAASVRQGGQLESNKIQRIPRGAATTVRGPVADPTPDRFLATQPHVATLDDQALRPLCGADFPKHDEALVRAALLAAHAVALHARPSLSDTLGRTRGGYVQQAAQERLFDVVLHSTPVEYYQSTIGVFLAAVRAHTGGHGTHSAYFMPVLTYAWKLAGQPQS